MNQLLTCIIFGYFYTWQFYCSQHWYFSLVEIYLMNYYSPHQSAPEMTPCTFCCEMECLYIEALMSVTGL